MAPDRYEQGRRDHANRRYDQRLADSDPRYRQGYVDAEISQNDAELAALRARGVGVGRAGSTERHWFPCLVWLVVPALLLIAAATALTSWGTT